MGNKKNKIYIIDVTNRDGVQTSRLGLAKLEKTIINFYLNDMGIYQSEFGFPFTNHEISYLKANLELAKMGVLQPIILSGWCRAVKDDVKRALAIGVEYLNISISTSQQMVKGKFQGRMVREPEKDLSRPTIIGMMVETLEEAKKGGGYTATTIWDWR
ncbi:Homocitrate synthase [subsurface metagenome]